MGWVENRGASRTSQSTAGLHNHLRVMDGLFEGVGEKKRGHRNGRLNSRNETSGAGGLLDAFSPDDFYRPPLEAVMEEIRRPRHGHFNIIHRDTALR